jgi:hypothetical protein
MGKEEVDLKVAEEEYKGQNEKLAQLRSPFCTSNLA